MPMFKWWLRQSIFIRHQVNDHLYIIIAIPKEHDPWAQGVVMARRMRLGAGDLVHGR
jgi:hypothetical protein